MKDRLAMHNAALMTVLFLVFGVNWSATGCRCWAAEANNMRRELSLSMAPPVTIATGSVGRALR
jgi:hypothetical protein